MSLHQWPYEQHKQQLIRLSSYTIFHILLLTNSVAVYIKLYLILSLISVGEIYAAYDSCYTFGI